jgi:anti-sigma-K factor RskA
MNVFAGDLPELLAAQYVIGTLRGGARRRFDALLPAHPVLRRAVAEWEARLAPMATGVEPIVPSPNTWSAIESRLGWRDKADTGGRWASLQLTLWQTVAAFSTAAAVMLGIHFESKPVAPPIVVVLRSTSGEPRALVAGLSADRRAVSIQPLERVAIKPQQTLELWALPRSGAPKSLGVIAPDKLTALARHELPTDTKGLAVSVEPLGGSPTGAPTGPVVFAGEVTL